MSSSWAVEVRAISLSFVYKVMLLKEKHVALGTRIVHSVYEVTGRVQYNDVWNIVEVCSVQTRQLIICATAMHRRYTRDRT